MTRQFPPRSDEQEIHDQLLRYCRAIDRCDEALLRTIYHPDATEDHGVFKGSADAFIAWVMPLLEESYFATSHCLSNVLIERDGDVAFSEAYVTAWHAMKKDGVDHVWIFGGRYIDRFERRNEAWKIASRITVCDWEHLSPSAGSLLPAGAFTPSLRSREDPAYRRSPLSP